MIYLKILRAFINAKTFKMKSDYDIQKDVMDQLRFDPLLNAIEIGVAVKKGVVTLSGLVDTYNKKLAAEKATKQVAGVRAIAEDIQVGVSAADRLSDAEIADAILSNWKMNVSVPDEKLIIKVENGIVSIEGKVDWNYQRVAAQSSIETLRGIKYIHNLISVKPSVLAKDVSQQISGALRRSAAIDASKIKVEVSGTSVTLTGLVRTFAEKDDAALAAWSVKGVTWVHNNIAVEQEQFAY